MRDAYVLFIPSPAPFIVANGSHSNYQAKAALVRSWRAKAAWVARASRPPHFEQHVRIVCWVNRGHSRGGRWDAANWAPTAKAAIDGLVDAGVLIDDSAKWVTGPDMRAGSFREGAGLTILITPHEPEKEPQP